VSETTINAELAGRVEIQTFLRVLRVLR